MIGVGLVSILKHHLGEDQLDSFVYAMLGGTLLMVGIITLARALILSKLIDERDDFEIQAPPQGRRGDDRRHHRLRDRDHLRRLGTVIAILLITVFRLTPHKVVGTDVFHAAILLWAAGLAHWVGGNVDFVLAGNILIGSVPGVVIGAALSD